MSGIEVMCKIIIYGPHGTGKTRYCHDLMKFFDSSILIDEWDGKTSLPDWTLALTNCESFDETLADAVFTIESALWLMKNCKPL